MKKLYVNGCSFVWGDELENREKEAFPFLLEKKLNCELINDSKCGASNERILRTTLSRDLSDSFVIIGWSSLFRYEYFEDGWETIYTQNQVPYLKVEWFIMNFINQVLALQNYLKYYNIPFFFFLSMSKNYQGRWKGIASATREHIKEWFDKFWKDINNKPVETWLDGYDNWFKFIDEDTFPSLFNTDLVFRDYIINNGGGLLKRAHPSKESHQLWANYLYDEVLDKYGN
jgi:hypothetical protein